MELNHSFYQIEDKDRLAAELYKLRSRRQFCLFEMENENHFQKNINMRKDYDRMRVRLFLCILIPLTVIIGYCIIKNSNAFTDAKGTATISMLREIWFCMLALPCMLGWYKVCKTICHLIPGGKYNIYEAELKESQTKYNSMLQEKENCDVKIRDKEIEYSRYLSIKNTQGDLSEQEQDAQNETAFRLKKDKVYSEEVRQDKRNEQKKQIEALKNKIQTEKQMIIDCKSYIQNLEIEYKHARTVIAEFGIGIIIIFILQLVSNDQMDGVLAGLAYLLIAALLILYVRRYNKIITAYNFEKNPTVYKDYAFRNGWVCCLVKEHNARKEIFDCEQELQRLKDKIVQIE